MRNHNGNFLLQALLALALISAFIPVFIGQRINRISENALRVAVAHIDQAIFAGNEYAKRADIPAGRRNFAGVRLTDVLAGYGLPPGFRTVTNLGQKISMFVARNGDDSVVMLELSAGDLPRMSRAALMQRIGPAAGTASKNVITGVQGDWKIDLSPFGLRPDPSSIYVRLDDNDLFVELVRISGGRQKFLTDLDMGENNLTDAHIIAAVTARIENTTATKINVSGNGKQEIKNMTANTGVAAAPVSFGRGNLDLVRAAVGTVSAGGDIGDLEADTLFVERFDMAAGRTGFTGGKKWHVRGNMAAKNFNLTTEVLQVGGTLNMTNVPDELMGEVYEQGISTATLYAEFVSLRDAYMSEFSAGGGRVLSEFRPAGTSVFTDAHVDAVNNDLFRIIKSPLESSGDTEQCQAVIKRVSNVSYDKNSVAQNIVCRYMFWHRLEQRINEKCRATGKC
ncbi:MAG: hypothetical protein LBR41_00760 [Rickettsiales bacterium]|jgi:hypothetical protein|nr:hypothetical protein [Rickettsiales bacterium]